MAGRRPAATSSSSPVTVLPSDRWTVTGPPPSRSTRVDRDAEPEVDAVLAQLLGEQLAGEGLQARQQALAAVEHDHLGAEAVPGLRHLQPDDPGAQTTRRPGTREADVASRLVHGRASRSPGTGGTAAVVPVASTTATRASTSHHGAVRGGDVHPALADEPAVPADQPDPGALEPGDLAGVVQAAGEGVPAGEDGRGVELARSPPRGHPATRRAARSAWTGRSRALLGMHAQYEHSPPTRSASTTSAVRPALDRPVGDVLAGRAGPHHDDVHGLHRVFLPRGAAGRPEDRTAGAPRQGAARVTPTTVPGERRTMCPPVCLPSASCPPCAAAPLSCWRASWSRRARPCRPRPPRAPRETC